MQVIKYVFQPPKILLFCSNPVNGGTPEIFFQFFTGMQEQNLQNVKFIPCVDTSNDVRVYDLIPNLKRVDVLSENRKLGSYKPSTFVFMRFLRRVIRNIRYFSTKRKNIKTFQNVLRENEIEAVLIHNGGYFGDDLCNQLIVAAHRECLHGKRVMVFHNAREKSFLNKIRFWSYDSMLKKSTTDIVCVSAYTKNIIEKNSSLRGIKVIHNGITFEDTLTVKQKKEAVNYVDADVNLVMVGNFMKNKGQLYLLKAFKKLIEKSHLNIRLTIIGNVYDKEYYKVCQDYILEEKLNDKIIIVHKVYNAREFYSLFDITVFTSVSHESFPTVIIESMRCGVPIIAFNCAGVSEEMTDGVEGYIVKKGDTEEMAMKVYELVINQKLRILMGKNAKQTYNTRFSRKVMCDKYLELLGIESNSNILVQMH